MALEKYSKIHAFLYFVPKFTPIFLIYVPPSLVFRRSSNESVHLKIPNSIISWALRQKTTEDLNALFSFGELKSYFGGSPGKNWLICLVDALQAVTLCPDLQVFVFVLIY